VRPHEEENAKECSISQRFALRVEYERLTPSVEAQMIHRRAGLPLAVGKSWIASALGNRACRDNRSVLYQRVPRLFTDLALGRGDGRHPRLPRALGRVDLLILDDWGLEQPRRIGTGAWADETLAATGPSVGKEGRGCLQHRSHL
jgi:hypothetical protein